MTGIFCLSLRQHLRFFTDLRPSLPALDLLFQDLLLCLQHPTLLTQLRISLLQRHDVWLQLLHLKHTSGWHETKPTWKFTLLHVQQNLTEVNIKGTETFRWVCCSSCSILSFSSLSILLVSIRILIVSVFFISSSCCARVLAVTWVTLAAFRLLSILTTPWPPLWWKLSKTQNKKQFLYTESTHKSVRTHLHPLPGCTQAVLHLRQFSLQVLHPQTITQTLTLGNLITRLCDLLLPTHKSAGFKKKQKRI